MMGLPRNINNLLQNFSGWSGSKSHQKALQNRRQEIEGASSKSLFESKSLTIIRAYEGNTKDLLKELVACDINEEDTYGRTALMYAAALGRKEIVKLLLDKGAEVNLHGGERYTYKKDHKKRTALMYAIYSGSKDTVKVLLDKGANLIQEDEEGRIALMYAAALGRKEIAALLLDNGSEIDWADENFFTVLTYAVFFRHLEEEIQNEVDNFFEKKVQDKLVVAPYMRYERSNSNEMVEYLIQRGVYVSPVNNGPSILSYEAAIHQRVKDFTQNPDLSESIIVLILRTRSFFEQELKKVLTMEFASEDERQLTLEKNLKQKLEPYERSKYPGELTQFFLTHQKRDWSHLIPNALKLSEETLGSDPGLKF